jgi:hypothetical protein
MSRSREGASARRLRRRVELLDRALAARQRPPLVAVEAIELGVKSPMIAASFFGPSNGSRWSEL